MLKTAVLVVGAGKGDRFGSERPKQYHPLGRKSIFAHSLNVFLKLDEITAVYPVIHKDHMDLYKSVEAECASEKLKTPIIGGLRRQGSVLNALNAIKDEGFDYVLIHDAARPFVAKEVILKSIEALSTHKAALVAMPVVDTLKYEDGGRITKTIPRDHLYHAQTPQAFHYKYILELHEKYNQTDVTDDISLAEKENAEIAIIRSSAQNFKITTQEDYILAQKLYGETQMQFETVTGFGYDVHQTEAGAEMILCNIPIKAPFKLKGHSDADVALHAITDAIYGALGEGDIGSHFPPSDQKWHQADSKIFIDHALERVQANQAQLRHIDVTVICEQPKIGPHRDQMRARLSEITKLPLKHISVKATTSEKLGFTGRGEGLAAQAVVSILRPYEA
jgi:2-C-methyl-D-erythritol 4-phosphate cytidylyltransferase/2-C-methyl-D-erythritol 2,4-cyclodiphosphate synthase